MSFVWKSQGTFSVLKMVTWVCWW